MARSYFAPALGMLLCAQGARAAGADPAAARAQLLQGYALKQKGQCEDAVPYFKESARLDRQPKALLNLADCEEKLRRLSAAQTHFLETRDVARSLGLAPYEKVAEDRLQTLEKNIPKLVIKLVRDAPPDTSVTRDGVELSQVSLQTPLPIDPGKHTVVARSELFEREYEITLSEGETKELEVTPIGGRSIGAPIGALPTVDKGEPSAKTSVIDSSPAFDPPRRGRAQRTAGIVVLGVGAAGIGLGIFSAAQFAAKNQTLSNTCTEARTCSGSAPYENVREDAVTARTLSIVGFASGAVALGAGLWLVLSAPSSTPRADRFASSTRTAVGTPPSPHFLQSVKLGPLIGGGIAGVVAGGFW